MRQIRAYCLPLLFIVSVFFLPSAGSASIGQEATLAVSPVSSTSSSNSALQPEAILFPGSSYDCVQIGINVGIKERQFCELYRELKKDFSSGRFDAIQDKCKQALRDQPNIWFFYLISGIAYNSAGETAKALSEIDKALHLRPNETLIRLWKAIMLLRQGNILEAQSIISALHAHEPENLDVQFADVSVKLYSRKYHQAISSYNTLLIKYPDKHDLHFGLAFAYAQMRRYDDALGEIDKYLAKNPWSQQGLVEKINILLHLGRKEAAHAIYITYFSGREPTYYGMIAAQLIAYGENDYQRAVEVGRQMLSANPGSPAGYGASFYAYLGKKDFISASEYLKKIDDRFPLLPYRYKMWGDLFFQQERYDDAAKYYQKALQENTGDYQLYLALGETYFALSWHREAIAVFKKGLAMFPDDYDFHRFVGRSYREMKDYDQAIKEYKTAIPLSPQRIGAHIGLAVTYRLTGKPDLALLEYNTALAISPSYFDARLGRASIYLDQEAYEEAIEEAELAIKLAPHEAKSYSVLAAAFAKSGQPEQAIRICKSMSNDVPLNAGGYSYVGWCYKDISEIDSSIMAFEKAMQLSPRYETALILGELYGLKGNLASQLSMYNAAVTLAPNNFLAYLHLAKVYATNNEYAKSASMYSIALEKDAPVFETLNNRGGVYAKNKDFDLALADFNKALEINSRNAFVLANRGKVYLRKGQLDSALADFSKALELQPSQEHYLLRAGVYVPMRKTDLALADLDKGLAFNPRNPHAYFLRGVVYLSRREADLAITDFNRTVELDPKSGFAYENRGSAYFVKGDKEKACDDWWQACHWGLCKRLSKARSAGICK